MLQDKTYKIKTWDHNDAVIYVTESYSYTKPDPNNPPHNKWVTKTEVIAVVPVSTVNKVDDTFIQRVQDTANSLAQLYQDTPDSEVKVQYVINAHPYVN